MNKNFKNFTPKNRADLRSWFRKNVQQKESIWVLLFKKGTGKENLSSADVTEEALCFGWIDSVPGKVNDESYKILVSPRKPKSVWSLINKKRIESLIKSRKMTKYGLEKINQAKESGTWNLLNSSDLLQVPKDLKTALTKSKKAQIFFESIAPSSKRAILEWIQAAKTKETRQKRIVETVKLAKIGIRANHYRDLEK